MTSALRCMRIQGSAAYREILPDYPHYGHSAPIRRNAEIVELADYVLIFWDGTSPGSRNVIQRCRDTGTPYRIELL